MIKEIKIKLRKRDKHNGYKKYVRNKGSVRGKIKK